jgi:hypothetical protein
MELIVVAPDDDLHMEMVNERPRSASIGEEVSVTWEVPLAKAEGFPRLIELTFHVAGDVSLALAAHLIADWVLARFKGKADKIVVNRREIEFEAGEVRRIIEETITQERGR